MSTKTAFKRVALVAAAALAIGGITAVSAYAVVPADLIVVNGTTIVSPATGTPTIAASVTQVAGPANYITLTPAIPTGSDYITVTGGTFVGGAASTVVTTAANLNVATPTVGTVTVSAYEITAGVASTTAQTIVTITVVATLPGTVYASATVLGATNTTTPTSGTDSGLSVVAASGVGSVANFTVEQKDAAGATLTTGFKTVTATTSIGTLTSTTGNVGPGGYNAMSAATVASSFAVATAAAYNVAPFPSSNITDFVLSGLPNVSGAATVTIAVNGVVVKTYTATFTGAPVKIVATAINPVIAVGNPANVTANTTAVKVQELDANGNAVAITNALTITPAATTTLSSTVATVISGTFADGSTISATANGLTLTGVAAGTTTFTVNDAMLSLASAPVSVRVSSATPTSVVITSNAGAYPAGGAGTIITTVSDAAGTLPAGTYAVFTGQETSSLALAVGTLSGAAPVSPALAPLLGSIVVKDDGTNTVAFNGPLSDGTVTVSATAAATTITVTPATFTVSSGSTDAANAATDAANEATDAANAATDAANAAADSADAATQAAQDASDQAAAALAAVTALSQQVTDLGAKLAAITASLAKLATAIAKLPKK